MCTSVIYSVGGSSRRAPFLQRGDYFVKTWFGINHHSTIRKTLLLLGNAACDWRCLPPMGCENSVWSQPNYKYFLFLPITPIVRSEALPAGMHLSSSRSETHRWWFQILIAGALISVAPVYRVGRVAVLLMWSRIMLIRRRTPTPKQNEQSSEIPRCSSGTFWNLRLQ